MVKHKTSLHTCSFSVYLLIVLFNGLIPIGCFNMKEWLNLCCSHALMPLLLGMILSDLSAYIGYSLYCHIGFIGMGQVKLSSAHVLVGLKVGFQVSPNKIQVRLGLRFSNPNPIDFEKVQSICPSNQVGSYTFGLSQNPR